MSRRSAYLAALVVFAATLILSIQPIRSYDFFWHLASGRWIADNGAIPQKDPFGAASDAVRWIDGEWLFQLAAYSLWTAGGPTAIVLTRALAVALLFAGLAFVMVIRAGPQTALPAAGLVLLLFAGAEHRLTDRPETVATLLLVLFILVARRPGSTRSLVVAAAVVAVWINVHPSALLAPVVAGLFAAGDWLSGERIDLPRRISLLIVCTAALLINPYGLHGVIAPLHLASAATGGSFVNLEWTRSRFSDFPLLYLVIPAAALAFVPRLRRRELGDLFVFLFFSFLALRFVRNQGFFFATLPLLLSAGSGAESLSRRRRWQYAVALASVAALIVFFPKGRQVGQTGISPLFPRCAAEQVESLALGGTIYNPDQWGGYLIWKFYPERRVLTDGRNELYATYLAEFDAARSDGRRWAALLDRYDVTVAVDEYRAPFTGAVDAVTGRAVTIAPSQAYWPRSEWALIGFDDQAMLFARRSVHRPELIAEREYRHIVPDAPHLRFISPGSSKDDALRELERAKRECGGGRRLNAIVRAIGG